MKKFVLLAVGAMFLCTSFTIAPSLFAQQYPPGDFSLYDGQMEISDGSWQFNSQEQELFSAATIKVKGGKVTMEASIPYTGTFEYGTANGTMNINGEGQYDEQVGTISGTFSYTNNGSSAVDDLSATLTSNCQGTFSTPPISSSQATVTVSFTGTMNATTTVGGVAIPASQNWSRDVVYKVAVDSGLRFASISGEVKILLPGSDEDEWVFAKYDSIIPFGTRIKTGEESHAKIANADLSVYFLSSEGEIIIQGEERKSNLELIAGKIWCNIKKMAAGDSIEVRTNQTVIGIKGTVFSLEEDGTTSTLKVFEGTVDFESVTTGESVMVVAGQTVSADKSGLGEIEDFDAGAEMAEWEALGADFSSGEDETKTGGEGESDGLSPWVYVTIAAAAVLVLALAGVALFASKRKKGAGTS